VLNLSLRGLRARPARSLTSAAGVAIATAGLTTFLALGAGLRQGVERQVDSIRPQLQVSQGGLLNSLAPAPTMPEATVRQVQAQAQTLALRFVTPVILQPQRYAGLSATLYGIPASAGLNRVYPYVRVRRGRHLQAADEGRNVAVIGQQLARHLGVRVGDVTVLTGSTRVRVIGILEPTRTVTDAFAVVPLRTLQRALGVPGRVSLAAVELAPGHDPLQVAGQLAARVGTEVFTQGEARQVTSRLLGSVDTLQWVLSGVALLVAFLSVVTTMTMASYERRRELAVLRALGLRPLQAAGLVLLDGLLLASAGGLLGLGSGALLAGLLGRATRQALGVEAAVVTPEVLLTVLAVSALIGLLAALPGAWRLSRGRLLDALQAT